MSLANHSSPSASLRDKTILGLGLVADRIGLSLLYIVFTPLARDISLSENQVGLLVAVANIALGLASPYWGRRSQTLGRKPVFVIGLTGYALGFVLLALVLQAGLSGWLPAGPVFFCLLAVRLFYGLVAAGHQPAATAYIADITDTSNRARGMALMAVAAGIGTVLGPALGGLLVGIQAVLPLYVAGAIAGFAAAAAVLGLKEPVKHAAPVEKAPLKFTDPRITPYLICWCLIILVLTGVQTITAFYLDDHLEVDGQTAVAQVSSLAFLIMGLAMIFVQAVILQLFQFSPVQLLRGGFAAFAAGLLLMATVGVGFSLINPGLNAGASLSVEPHEQGAVAGLVVAAPVLGMVLGPMLGTLSYGMEARLPMAAGSLITLAMCLYWMRTQA